jgi:GntR family transcriptional regulator
MKIDGILERSPQPLYLQMASIFRHYILSGAWKVGERIPSLVELGATTGVARITLRQAFDILEEEGLIHRGRGSGTFVCDAIPEVMRLSLPRTWAETIELSRRLGTQTLMDCAENRTLPEPLGIACECERAAGYCHMRRLHEVNGTPVCFSDVYVETGIYRKHKARLRKETVAPLLDAIFGKRITQARQLVTIIEAGAESARALRIPVATPVAEVRRFACVDDKVVYFARLEFPTRFVKFDFDLLKEI